MADMNLSEALDLAIFAVNNFTEPEASRPSDVTYLDESAEQVLGVLDMLRTLVNGGSLSEPQDTFVACEADFMAGTICSLRKGHSGPHGTICHRCGADWYTDGHAPECPYFHSDEDEEDVDAEAEHREALDRFKQAKANADRITAEGGIPRDMGALMYFIGELEDAVASAAVLLKAEVDA